MNIDCNDVSSYAMLTQNANTFSMPLQKSRETAVLDRTSPIPLYHQLRVIFQQQIQNGEWPLEAQIPTEESFASQYGVSKVTIRQALKQLSDDGFLRREQGRGTFVSKPKVEQGPRKLTSFSQEMDQHGMRASSQVLEQTVFPASEELAQKMNLAAGALVFSLKRLRLADDEPMGIQTAFLPLDLVPGIENEDFAKKSLYATLADHFGLRPVRAREEHYAVALEEADADLLRIPAGSPALAAERLTYLGDGRPLELTLSVMRGDRYKIILNLTDFTA